jgi:hypothetical protein
VLVLSTDYGESAEAVEESPPGQEGEVELPGAADGCGGALLQARWRGLKGLEVRRVRERYLKAATLIIHGRWRMVGHRREYRQKVVNVGGAELVCCGEAMKLMEEKTADEDSCEIGKFANYNCESPVINFIELVVETFFHVTLAGNYSGPT